MSREGRSAWDPKLSPEDSASLGLPEQGGGEKGKDKQDQEPESREELLVHKGLGKLAEQEQHEEAIKEVRGIPDNLDALNQSAESADVNKAPKDIAERFSNRVLEFADAAFVAGGGLGIKLGMAADQAGFHKTGTALIIGGMATSTLAALDFSFRMKGSSLDEFTGFSEYLGKKLGLDKS